MRLALFFLLTLAGRCGFKQAMCVFKVYWGRDVMKKVLLLSGLMVCGAANAAEEVDVPSFRMGEVSVFPGLGLVVKNDSNIYRTKVATASTVSVLSPSVVLKAEKEALTAGVALMLDAGNYSKASVNNYLDQKVLGQLDYEPTSRSTLKFSPSYIKGHDEKGSTFGVQLADPNKYTEVGAGGSWKYGADEARMSTLLDLNYSSRQYDNNRTVTAGYDKNLRSVAGTVYVRVMPKTSLLLNAKNTGINYKSNLSTLDGNEQRVMIGAKWEATAQTSGEVKVGQLKKKYDAPALQSFTGGSWEGIANWSPVSYVKVDVNTSRAPVETTLAGSRVIMVNNTGLNVAYDLNDRVQLSVNGSQVQEDFVGAGRKDNTNNVGVQAEYKFRSWLIGSAGYTSSAKTSNALGADYKRNILFIGLRTAL